MLVPVKASLEDYLGRVDDSQAAAAGTRPAAPPQAQPVRANAGDMLFQDASPTNVDDAYNALKTSPASGGAGLRPTAAPCRATS
ncbi:hypothetical protein G6F32_016984 [Rhizopus arrhizus]|nr:hypothetical protein G6F32_016984 [Rhizopus arrhizus]